MRAPLPSRAPPPLSFHMWWAAWILKGSPTGSRRSPLPAACQPCLWDRDRGWAEEAIQVGNFKEGSATLIQRPPSSRAGLEKSSPPTGKGQGELGCERLPKKVSLVVQRGSIPEMRKGPVCPLPLCQLLSHHAPHRGYGPFTQPPPALALLRGQTPTALPPSLPSIANHCAGSNREAPKHPRPTGSGRQLKTGSPGNVPYFSVRVTPQRVLTAEGVERLPRQLRVGGYAGPGDQM